MDLPIMTKNSPKTTRFMYLNADQERRLTAAYATSQHAWKRDKQGRWTRKSASEFMADLVFTALDADATLEGSRVVLAGRFGERISLKLDGLLLILRVILDLFCLVAKITDAQKNEAFRHAAADLQFDQRLTDLRAFYRAKPSETGTPDDEMGTNRGKI